MEIDKKRTVINILLIALIVSGIGNIYFILAPIVQTSSPIPSIPRTLIVGQIDDPYDLDPLHTWDSSSYEVIEQVCEGLYQNDLSDPNLGIIPILAVDYGTWNPSATKLTIPLRQDVLFHDGTKFNASSVQWTFERINYFINASGMPWILNETSSRIRNLFEFPNGTTIFNPINPITINSEYNVTINLRAPYAILEALLCHVSTYMLSPESTPKYEYIELIYGRIVGTGPFVYDYYIPFKEATISRWDNYWREPTFFEKVFFRDIYGYNTRNNAMLDHTIDYLIGPGSSYFPLFDTDITITHQTGIPSLSCYFVIMNNTNINETWRRAIYYAINWTYIIEERLDGYAIKSNGPLAPNFPMYDSTIKAATYNLTKAREIVVSMGFGDMEWNDSQWNSANFAIWNYTSYSKSGHHIGEYVRMYLEDIGIFLYNKDVWDIESPLYLNYGCLDDDSGLRWAGWAPDFLSPFDLLFPLFSNKSELNYNYIHYYNHDVEMWLEQILKEPDVVLRQALYSNILHQIVEVDIHLIFAYHPYQHYVHSADINGVPYNAMGTFYIYPMYRV